MAPGKTFEGWWEQFGQHWAAARVERGGVLWTADEQERRSLFERRHQRPEPPEGLHVDPRPTRTWTPIPTEELQAA